MDRETAVKIWQDIAIWAPVVTGRMIEAFANKVAETERERADYAWKNTRTIEAARQEEMNKRDAAEREAALLRAALEPFADIRAADIDALPDSAGFSARRNGTHVTYGDIRRARELLRSNDLAKPPGAALCDRSA